MRLNLLLFFVILPLLGSCATTYRNDSLARLQTLPQHYAQFDVQMAWEVRSTRGSTLIKGVVKNIRYFEMDELELRVYSLDEKGKEVHHAVDFVNTLRENDVATFTLKLPQLASGSRLRFTYSYIGSDGGGEFSAISWMQSFESAIP